VKVLPILAVVLAVVSCSPAERPEAPQPVQEASPQMIREAGTAFRTLRDGFVEWYLESNPVRASELGVTAHDARLPGMDRVSIQSRIDALLDWESQLRRIPIRLMREGDRFDYAVVEFGIRSELLELEEIRRWVVDPRGYTELIARGVSSVAEHRYAAPSERAGALSARLAGGPAVLAAARSNLRSPPRSWTELGIEHAALLLRYVEEELPVLLESEAGWAAVADRVEPARLGLAAALREHLAWLETELLPISTADFRLGRYLFARQLLYGEHVGVSIDELERLNEQNIALYQERLQRTATEIDPGRSVRAVLDSVARLQPAPEELVAAAGALVGEARSFVVSSNLVSVPAATLPTVRESPAYARQQRTSLSSPGPFAEPAAGAFFNVTPPSPDWPAEQRSRYMRHFSQGGLVAATLHETFPGRYLYEQHARAAADGLRQVFVPRSMVEGWAHYGEQVMLDEGFRAGDAGARLAQLRRALEAHARWYAALHLHAFNRPEAQVVERVMELAHLDEASARREVARVAHDPGAMAEAFGRVQILELRRAYEAFLGEREESTFSLRQFHDRLLELSLPLPLAAEALMPPPAERTPGPRARPTRRVPAN
jgi:hypothetical protein